MNRRINKIIISIVLLFIFIGCAVKKRGNIELREEERILEGIDLTEYSKKGFLITAGDYGEDFESIGMFSFSIYPQARRIENEKTVTRKKGEQIIKIYTWEQEKPNLQEALDFIYHEALLRKADGIINLKVDYINKQFMDGDYTEFLTGIKVDGFFIKRIRSSE